MNVDENRLLYLGRQAARSSASAKRATIRRLDWRLNSRLDGMSILLTFF